MFIIITLFKISVIVLITLLLIKILELLYIVYLKIKKELKIYKRVRFICNLIKKSNISFILVGKLTIHIGNSVIIKLYDNCIIFSISYQKFEETTEYYGIFFYIIKKQIRKLLIKILNEIKINNEQFKYQYSDLTKLLKIKIKV